MPPEGINLREVIASFEKRLIESTLESTGGVQKDAARLLGLKPTTLNEMIKRHSILLPRDRERRAVGRDEAAGGREPSRTPRLFSTASLTSGAGAARFAALIGGS